MGKYRICAYAISKNEEQFADRWMDSVSEADMVVVLDTGSTDKTVERLRERGALVYTENITPWRFDTARNIAMDHIPEDVDICVSSDLDEIFEPGWRNRLEEAWSEECAHAVYLFAWSHNPDGTVQKQYPMEKIHRRHGFRWVHPVHEVLKYGGEGEDRAVWINGLVAHHYPDKLKERSQYLPLLELSVAENPQDDRAMFWLGREYFAYGDYKKAEETLKRHLALPSAKWDEERSASMRLIGGCCKARGDRAGALSWLLRALAECQGVRETYLELAQFGYEEKNWPMVYAMAQRGLSVTLQTGSYLTRPECWGPALYDYAAIAAYGMGLYEKAGEYALRACEFEPSNERLKNNLIIIGQKTGGRDSSGGAP